MAKTVTGKLRVIGSYSFSDTGADGGETENAETLNVNLNFGAGTAAASVNKVIARLNGFTITASSSIDVDLAGAISDFVGAAITMDVIKYMVLQLTSTTGQADSVLIGSKGTNGCASWLGGTNHSVKVLKGGIFALACTNTTGYAVTAATGDIITLTNNDTVNSASYKLIICGVDN